MTFSKVVAALAAFGAAAAADLPENVVDCGKYKTEADRECVKVPAPGGAAVACVEDGWFSKTNNVAGSPNHRVDALQVCLDQGYTGVDENEFGGNWGRQCNYPGPAIGQATKTGGVFTELGFTVSWKCSGDAAPVTEPTTSPTQIDQPDGDEMFLQMFMGCDKNGESMTVPFIWAPGQCQRDPFNEEDTMIINCEDGGISVQIFNSPNCQENPQDNMLFKHDQCTLLGGEDNGEEEGGMLALLPDEIRRICKDPSFKPVVVPQPVAPVSCTSVGDPHFNYFNSVRADFQARGEFDFWKTQGLTIQVRHGPNLLATHVNTVSTNNAIAIGGSQVCGHKFEIYAEEGGWMRFWPAGATTANEYFGIANVVAAIQTFDCPTVAASGVTIAFRFDNSMMNVHVVSYGINIYLNVEGPAYLETDRGICTQRPGWDVELNCLGTLFTHYPEGDCALLPRPEVIPFNIDECDGALRVEAEKVCNQCPETIHPEDCVLEVCALGSVEAAADLLEACEIEVPIAPPRDVHCTSLGDPHFQYFDTTRADFQDRGEFVLYDTTGVTVMTRHGPRPDVPAASHVSTNHGVTISGDWTCGSKYEFYHNDPAVAQVSNGPGRPVAATPMLKVTDNQGQTTIATGAADITALLNQRNRCSGTFIGTRGAIHEIAMQGGAVRVRVQFAWWGINVWVDVEGAFYLSSDSGICTKRTGSFEQASCDDSTFTVYPTTCEELVRTYVPPTPVLETCAESLKIEAREACDACPDVVDIDDCVFEVCAIGDIVAAEQLIAACPGGEPIVPVPTPAPAPKRDVQCVSAGDPHFRYFDLTGGDFQSRGMFTLYKTNTWEVQVRQGVFLGLPTTHPAYNIVSTNNAFVVAGDWLCNQKYEVDAATQSMKITDSNGNSQTYSGFADIAGALQNQNCPAISISGTVVSFGDNTDYQMRWQMASWGINVWIDVRGAFYLDTDSGICTKREGWTEPLECADVLFTEYPEGKSCEEEKENDKDIAPTTLQDTQCDDGLKREAEQVCQKCPNVVAPRDCILETCLLGTIDAATELLKACELAPPADCGEPGKVSKKGATKVKGLKRELGGKKAESACACRDACEAVGGTEWVWKVKRGRCQCYEGATAVAYNAKAKKAIAGTLDGSTAAITRKA